MNRLVSCINQHNNTVSNEKPNRLTLSSCSSVKQHPLSMASSSVKKHHSVSSGVEKQPETSHDHHSSSDEDEDENQTDFCNLNLTLELDPSIHDPRDQATPDRWVRRNQSMIRLTGKHPFNAEPPVDKLMGFGFITPAPIHFVRTHGYVPRGRWEDWTVEVTGLVQNPMSFTMDRLVTDFPSFQMPVTLVCAGNRRKEQNMLKQTLGFNWGSGAVSTSVWRGVRLRDVLKRCGVFNRSRGALNVCFQGAEDLPGGGGSKYGTSMRKELAMDPARDVMIAYMQNGERLLPDHGYPVRMIIPGFIGGRMVKWLTRIIVTTKESDSYYHHHDNRVLPSHVDAELADSQGWWYKPEYIITELNINSVITTPSDGDALFIDAATTTTLKGYAYSGGGKKVTRVEVTLDGGESWLHCVLDHQETPNRYGKYWCWCFWSLQLQLANLRFAKEIAVRAWDETLNTQPENLIWNVMGMMNNCWFRVKITNVCVSQQGELRMVFKHPTQPGNNPGGWMVPNTKNLESSEASTSSTVYSMDEIKKHNSAESAWIVIHGSVYDCTNFLNDHPGGADSILTNSGIDCTEEFDDIHSQEAKSLLGMYKIGEVTE